MTETALQPWQGAIKNSERKFSEIVSETNMQVAWKAESMFVLQVISNNEFLTRIANENPNSLRDAIINVASTGLTLNPALAYAYIIPRDGKACLDISYKGLIKLATDTGSMIWVRADVVFKNDSFTYHGPAKAPTHNADPFSPRGEMVGVYCMAKTTDGDILTEVMSVEEINKVRSTSMSYAKYKKGPWKDWPGEMARKTVIKRASKTWPRTERSLGLAKAVEILNEDHDQALIVHPEAEEPLFERLCDEVDQLFNKEAGFTLSDIEIWEENNKESIGSLSDVESGIIKSLIKDAKSEFVEAKPKTFKCSSGLEVVATDCDQCPKCKECAELKEFKENK